MRTIAIVNQKGGCGKTTTAINLAALYAKRGLRTLLVDMDPQSHCAAGLGVPEARIEYSIGDALLANHGGTFDSAPLVWEVARNLHLAPSTMMLSALEAPGGGLHQLPDKDRRLQNLLAAMSSQYDRCLIDCPPTIGLLTFNALRAAKEALIPVETGFFALRGAEKQWTTIQRMIAHIDRPIACHLLATLHNPQSQLACNILAALRRQFAGQIMPVVIHEDEALREAASLGQPVMEYAPDSTARSDFEALADWLEEHATRPAVHIEVFSRQPHATEPEHIGATACITATAGDAHAATNRNQQSSTGGRAAELARRVHDLAARAANRKQETTSNCDVSAVARPDECNSTETAIDPACQPTPHTVQDSVALPKAASPLSLEEIATSSAAPAADNNSLTHLYGVRQTVHGVLFVQPARSARTLAVAGDFNHWSATANPFRYNEEIGVFETIIKLPPGTYQYRLVADGQWLPDVHNSQQQLNVYGEPNSLLTVT